MRLGRTQKHPDFYFSAFSYVSGVVLESPQQIGNNIFQRKECNVEKFVDSCVQNLLLQMLCKKNMMNSNRVDSFLLSAKLDRLNPAIKSKRTIFCQICELFELMKLVRVRARSYKNRILSSEFKIVANWIVLTGDFLRRSQFLHNTLKLFHLFM